MDYTLIRSKRRTLSIEIKKDGSIIVRAPMRMSKYTIEKFISEKSDWIFKHLEIVKSKHDSEEDIKKLSEEELKNITKNAKAIIPQRLELYSKLLGVHFEKVTYRHQKTVWGSCSGKNNLNFNVLITLMPEDIMDYVIVHELCHIKQHNHSKLFWNEVQKIIPEYKQKRKWLKENGSKFLGLVY